MIRPAIAVAIIVIGAVPSGCDEASAPPLPPSRIAISTIAFDSGGVALPPDLFTMAPEGQDFVQVTHTDAWEMHPEWSPDRTRIAYQWLPPSGFLSQAEIHIINADGAGDHAVVGPGSIGPPSWSPDGKSLAFDQISSAGRALVLLHLSSGVVDTVLDRGAEDSWPSWSPDGSTLAFSSNCRANVPACWVTTIWTVRLDGTELRQLTFADPADSLGQQDSSWPRWSPDGRTLAITSHVGGFGKVYLLSAGGGALVPLTPTALEAWSATWSPDGRRIAFIGRFPTAGPDVYVVDSDGAGLQLVRPEPGYERMVSWGR